uniref:Transmembrane protein 170 n=1 Tax=Caligus clemensi TaxID=344056 RepID=C1C002_CALCM|nr:Transmembrane protein 170 [Caligus clemensi]
MWYLIFIWCLGSSLFLSVLGALGAFCTLRKHKFGRFYSLMILFMGLLIPLSLGMISSAAIAFVYKTSNFKMDYTHAMMWGIGQTVIHAAFGATRILATL